MTDNEKLARWQGNPNFSQITLILQTDTGYWPDYHNDDSAAMSLLDTLVEKRFHPEMYYATNEGIGYWYFKVSGNIDVYSIATTRREAVVAAVLELIHQRRAYDLATD